MSETGINYRENSGVFQSAAIIGAGMAGLAAAREITAAGGAVTIYEKSAGLGGRVATRRVGGCLLDHGAQVLKPDGSTLGDVMQNELSRDDLVQVLAPTRQYANDGAIREADPQREAERKFVYRRGLTTLPKLLAQSLPSERTVIRYETRIGALEEDERGILLRDENGREAGRAEVVIVAAPAPQGADLLANSRLKMPTDSRIEALRGVAYHPCLTVLLGYAPTAPPPPAYALLAEDRSNPLLWLAFEQTKAPERAPNGEALLIAQFGPDWSRENYDQSEDVIRAAALEHLCPLFGDLYALPQWAQVKRWRYSQPRGMADFAAANPEGSAVLVCGDALRPDNGRVHQAYASGLEAARRALGVA